MRVALLRRALNKAMSAGAVVVLLGGSFAAPDTHGDSGHLFYSSGDFTVTEQDLALYLGVREQLARDVSWGSEERVQQGIYELYTLKSLARAAERRDLVSRDEEAWIAYYAVALEKAKRLIAAEVESAMKVVDWSAEARDYYTANPSEFIQPPSITVRALLLRTESRSVAEAIELAQELVPPDTTLDRFEEIVKASGEDPAGGDGKIEKMRRGQTVPEFEAAAFALSEVGDLSEPVVSRFGVHVIQLLNKKGESVQPFESVEGKIVATLKKKRSIEFANSVKSGPSMNPAEDVVIHQDQIDAFLEAVRTQNTGVKVDSPPT